MVTVQKKFDYSCKGTKPSNLETSCWRAPEVCSTILEPISAKAYAPKVPTIDTYDLRYIIVHHSLQMMAQYSDPAFSPSSRFSTVFLRKNLLQSR